MPEIDLTPSLRCAIEPPSPALELLKYQPPKPPILTGIEEIKLAVDKVRFGE